MEEKQYDRLLDFVLRIKSDQDEIKEILIKNTVVLDEHIRRTELAEERLDVIEAAMEPVRDHIKSVVLILKLAGGALAGAGTIAGILEVIRNLHSN